MNITKADLQKASQTSVFRQGERLFKRDAVEIDQHHSASVRGTVYDYIDYQISITQNSNGQLQSHCSCRSYLVPCAHVVAILLAVIEQNAIRQSVAPKPTSWRDYLKNLPALSNRSALQREVQTTKLLFFLRLSPVQWRLQAAPTYIKKNGEIGRRARLHLGYDGELRQTEATPAEQKVIKLLAQQARAKNDDGFSYSYS